jgi:hypothetical protein
MFKSLDSILAHLEEKASSYEYIEEIGDLFQKLRNDLSEKKLHKKAMLAQYEVDAWNLMLKDGQLDAQIVRYNDEGEEIRIPDINKFTDDEFGYFEHRLEQTENQTLRARYAHILWQSPKKRQQYADAAISAYLDQISEFEDLMNAAKDDNSEKCKHERRLLECVKCAFCLALSSRQKIDKITSEIWRMIQNPDSDNPPRYVFTEELIKLVSKDKKHFKTMDLRILCDICKASAEQLESKDDLHGAIRMNELGHQVDQVLKIKTVDWNILIANCYEKLMTRREKSPMVAFEWCQRAMDYYKVAGDDNKVEELAKKREEFGGGIEFQEVATEIDRTDYIAECEEIGKQLSNLSTDEILVSIAADPNLLPLKDEMELLAKKSAKETPLISLIPEPILDDRLHVVEHAVTKEEKLKRGILKEFELCLEFEKLPLIKAIIIHSFQAGKLDADKVLNHLISYSWLGAELKRQRGTNKEYVYCWLDQCGPAIRAYFSLLNDIHDNRDLIQLPILIIDSLTLKFEGLIRDYAQLSSILTNYDTHVKAGRSVTREKNLALLLYDSRIANLFNPDDLLFFRFMFIEHSGLTLRHRVAHSLMCVEEYSIECLHLLFVALMRLAKYDIKLKLSGEN